MQRYVAGFMFDGDEVVLVRKNKPEWQKGQFNGVGGKIEDGETAHQAMTREFEEETGVFHLDWSLFASLHGDGWVVNFFRADGDSSLVRTMEGEEIVRFPVDSVSVLNCIPNLTWLIPMAKSMSYDRSTHFTIAETY